MPFIFSYSCALTFKYSWYSFLQYWRSNLETSHWATIPAFFSYTTTPVFNSFFYVYVRILVFPFYYYYYFLVLGIIPRAYYAKHMLHYWATPPIPRLTFSISVIPWATKTNLHTLSLTFLYFTKTSVTVPPNRTVFLGGELKKLFFNASISEILWNQDYQTITFMRVSNTSRARDIDH